MPPWVIAESHASLEAIDKQFLSKSDSNWRAAASTTRTTTVWLIESVTPDRLWQSSFAQGCPSLPAIRSLPEGARLFAMMAGVRLYARLQLRRL